MSSGHGASRFTKMYQPESLTLEFGSSSPESSISASPPHRVVCSRRLLPDSVSLSVLRSDSEPSWAPD